MSPALRPQALEDLLRSGAAPPAVIAAIGPETFIQERVLAAVATTLLGDPESPELITLQGGAVASDVDQETVSRFFDETRTGSLFGTRKVVALRHAGALVTRNKDAFLAWLANPGRAATAVLLAEQLPRPVAAALEKSGVLVHCGGRGGRSSESPARFAKRRAAARGKLLGPGEAELLVELLGGDLATLENAVEILSLHSGEHDEITRTDVDALFQTARDGSIWEFGDKLVEGDVAGALVESDRCFTEGVRDYGGQRVTRNESAISVRLLSSFSTAVTRALAVRRQLDDGVRRGDIAWPKSVPWPAQKRVLGAATRRRRAALEALVIFAEDTDRSMKSGGVVGRVAIARLATAVRSVR